MEDRKAQASLAKGYLGGLLDKTTHLVKIDDIYGNNLARRSGIVASLAKQFPEVQDFWWDPSLDPTLGLYIRAHYSLWAVTPGSDVPDFLRAAGILDAVALTLKNDDDTEDSYLHRVGSLSNILTRAFLHGECRYMLNPDRLALVTEEYQESIIQQYSHRIAVLGMNPVLFDTSMGYTMESTLVWDGSDVVEQSSSS